MRDYISNLLHFEKVLAFLTVELTIQPNCLKKFLISINTYTERRV